MTQLINLAGLTSHPNEREKEETDNNILFDSGANVCITNALDDFHGHCDDCPVKHGQVDGIGKTLQIKAAGMLSWTFAADNGMCRTLKLPGCHVPSSLTRIASLQVILKACPQETISMTANALRSNGHDQQPSITVPFELESNLPTLPSVDPNDHDHKPDDPCCRGPLSQKKKQESDSVCISHFGFAHPLTL